MYRETTKCLICGNAELVPVLDLGAQALTGRFPRTPFEAVTEGPLELVKCHSEQNANVCGLVQLRHGYDLDEMYGEHYGYRSGLNASMVRHLNGIVDEVTARIELRPGDLVLDIGSNDGTLLSKYPQGQCEPVGIDPTGAKFRRYYPDHVQLVPDFFSGASVRERFTGCRARVITSISMFYDLPAPMEFVNDVQETLTDDGLWVFEQSYLPTMLEKTSYDTVCHEHLEYYGLTQIQWMFERTGMRILDVSFNDANGGSFRVTACRADAPHVGNPELVQNILTREEASGLGGLDVYHDFARRVSEHCETLTDFVRGERSRGKKFAGYGASTKGNVVLQYCGFTSDDLCCIAEVNEDKFGSVTPATHIPIVSEPEARLLNPDYFLVLPWHFRESIVQREQAMLQDGKTLLFPLPGLELVDRFGVHSIGVPQQQFRKTA